MFSYALPQSNCPHPTDFKDTNENILTHTSNYVFLRNTEGLFVNVNVFIKKV